MSPPCYHSLGLRKTNNGKTVNKAEDIGVFFTSAGLEKKVQASSKSPENFVAIVAKHLWSQTS